MSSKNQNRIKQIRQKNASGNYMNYPIGSQGTLVDMLSELDLEEELKIGGNHYVQVDNISDELTQVREWYYNKPKSENGTVVYSLKITISTGVSDEYIVITHDSEKTDPEGRILINSISNDYLIHPQFEDTTFIEIQLYKGDFSVEGQYTLIHEKTIRFDDIKLDESNDFITTTIEEQEVHK